MLALHLPSLLIWPCLACWCRLSISAIDAALSRRAVTQRYRHPWTLGTPMLEQYHPGHTQTVIETVDHSETWKSGPV
ncbi:uncharacterized protein ASPGLDRAFT_599930 [Aspergillus glaucus CBS 516.65]|uniref:Secreted protein n=1 Tax=Aspergillus glaucus CBS 516.65 TaxID=1160497 RepID=A0A1L9VDC8_ASPGL|nr:hypothetical protein ASPGLDRAFT_599930 [Aspergillus glaucus CBS 516.65]OJJ81883.1 hypothetical protein ASPGLDRAFT_599930 [Aspergillus glaucus CBS 516.65]